MVCSGTFWLCLIPAIWVLMLSTSLPVVLRCTTFSLWTCNSYHMAGILCSYEHTIPQCRGDQVLPSSAAVYCASWKYRLDVWRTQITVVGIPKLSMSLSEQQNHHGWPILHPPCALPSIHYNKVTDNSSKTMLGFFSIGDNTAIIFVNFLQAGLKHNLIRMWSNMYVIL
jgi:hypothetical protein